MILNRIEQVEAAFEAYMAKDGAGRLLDLTSWDDEYMYINDLVEGLTFKIRLKRFGA